MHTCQRCGDCCGPVPANDDEYAKIKAYSAEHGIKANLDNPGLQCPYLSVGECLVYPVRPLICRVYGYIETLPCNRQQTLLDDLNIKVWGDKIRVQTYLEILRGRPLLDVLLTVRLMREKARDVIERVGGK